MSNQENYWKKINKLAQEKNVDLSSELKMLEEKLHNVDAHYKTPIEYVNLARDQSRPTCLELIKNMSRDFMEFHGDRLYGDDPAVVGGIAHIADFTVTFIGHEKGHTLKNNVYRNYGMASPEGYRKALRLAQQAQKFSRPIITFVNTPGAYPGVAAEEHGIGQSIAENLKAWAKIDVPILCFLLGEGGSGGALAIAVADKIYMLENTIYSVISPEGFASIVLRDPSQTEKASQLLKMTAPELKKLGVIDDIISENHGQASPLEIFSENIKNIINQDLKVLTRQSPRNLLRERENKFYNMGLAYLKQN